MTQGAIAVQPTPFLAAEDVKRILVLAIPAMLAFLTQTLVNIVDTYFFGLLEEPSRSDGQAMMSLSLPLLWAIGGFFSAVSVGTQAMVARRCGAKLEQEAGRILPNAVVLATVTSAVASVIGWTLIPSVFHAASDNTAYVTLGSTYTRWRFVGMVSMVVTASYKAFFDGIGRTYVHLLAAIVMNIINLILCWGLIFGHWGFPNMGVEGAGLAAAISSWVGLGVMVLFSIRPEIWKRFHPYQFGAVSWTTLKELTCLSLPSGVATTAVMTGFILFRQIVQRLDDARLASGGLESVYGAATTIIIQILSVTFFSCLAFGVATATLVSQHLGAGDPDSAERYAWSSVKIASLAFGVVGLLEILYPAHFIGIFNRSYEVILVGSPALRLVGFCGPFIAAGMILTQALFGAGNTKFVMIVELVLHFGCLVPLAYVFGIVLNGGLVGVWSAAAVYAVLLTGLVAWKFHQGCWKKIRL